MYKLLLFLLLSLITLIGSSQGSIKVISEGDKSSEARNYYLSASEKAESGDCAGVIRDLVKIMFLDSGYIKAKFHYERERYSYGSRENLVQSYQNLLIRVVHPRSEIRNLKNSIYIFKNMKRARKYLKGEIRLDIFYPELQNIKKLYVDHLTRRHGNVFASPEHYLAAIFTLLPQDGQREHYEIQQQFNINLQSKEFRDALWKDYNNLLQQQNSETQK